MVNISKRRKTVNASKISVNRELSITHQHRRGFSLIEILVVITIIGLLTTMGAFSFSKTLQKARDGKRKSDLQAIRRSLEGYFQKFGSYPLQDGVPPGQIMCADTYSNVIAWGDPFICETPTLENITFMPNLPKDPLNTAPYICSYTPSSYTNPNYFSYLLQAQLENTNDPELSNLSCTPTLGYNYCVKNP